MGCIIQIINYLLWWFLLICIYIIWLRESNHYSECKEHLNLMKKEKDSLKILKDIKMVLAKEQRTTFSMQQ